MAGGALQMAGRGTTRRHSGPVGVPGRTRSKGRLRVWLGVASLGPALVAGVALLTAAPAQAQAVGQAFPPDIQASLPDPGPDAYRPDACAQSNCGAPDPISVHVGATPAAQAPLAGGA